MSVGNRLFRFLVGLDQAFDPLVYGGSENVTISSMTAYLEITGSKHAAVTRKVLDWIFGTFFRQTFHCYASLWGEMNEFTASQQAEITHYLAGLPAVAQYLGIKS